MRALPLLILCLLPGLAAAQPQSPAPPPPEREIIFDPDTVEGTPESPNGEVVVGQRRVHLPSLVRVRDDFRPELLDSADDL